MRNELSEIQKKLAEGCGGGRGAPTTADSVRRANRHARYVD